MTANSSPHRDVRMCGFASRTTVEASLAWVDLHAQRLASESVSIWQAAGRVLADDVVSTVAVPAFPRSMMDGFALRAESTMGATSYNRLELRIVGQSLPGRSHPGVVASQEAVRIMTGAPLPAGTNAVLPAERVEVRGEQLLVIDEVPPGKNVGQPGEDVQSGATVLHAGRVLRPQDLGLLSSLGHATALVVRQPVVQIVIAGNELLPAGDPPQPERTLDANGPMLAALVVRDGGRSLLRPENYLVPDDPAAILAAMRAEADIVIVAGGSSVGQEDYAPGVLAEHGELAIHGIAMRPSSPTGMGRLDGRLVFLLPGNPVSCLCAYDFFAGRAIRLLGGRSSQWPYRSVRLPLARKLVSQVGRVDYARVAIVAGQIEPLAISGASILSSTTAADGFVVIPGDSEGYSAGTEVNVLLYDQSRAGLR
jgi:molybdopterin molybdotransferase